MKPDENTGAVPDLSDSERVPVGYIGEVQRENWPAPERAVFHSRVGHILYVRAADPCDPESERIPVYEGDEVVVLEHYSHIGHHTEKEGSDGFLLSQRIVPAREEHGKVFARTLEHGEHDDGRRCHVRPGDELVINPQVQLDYVDEWEGQDVHGYVPLTPVLWTWMAFGTHHSDDKHRYLLAAARRLDRAQTLFQQVEGLRQFSPEGDPAKRRVIFELIGATELAVLSLSRALDMCEKATCAIGTTIPVPPGITEKLGAVTNIRNAYEHIEDRALGKVWKKPHPDALTIFDHDRVVTDNVVRYGADYLDLDSEVPELIQLARQYLKDVAGQA
ncbi:light-mediated development protein DET1 [Rhodococcus gordoniae]|uniref:light-mediated development protein DET1 n=1 Tax=Rhodococcus gordoniae TaxID=223392 RepID=UPI0020CCB23F|nr:light-mediated development protein DET1 [Rhodococcus gordoniae]UTT48923.1 light-mediated development protein DET1 [Rhodococcus gordoniae]